MTKSRSVSNVLSRPVSAAILTGAVSNTSINSISISIGNTATNTTINNFSISLGAVSVVNNTSLSVGNNNRVNTSTLVYSGDTNTTVNNSLLVVGNLTCNSTNVNLGVVSLTHGYDSANGVLIGNNSSYAIANSLSSVFYSWCVGNSSIRSRLSYDGVTINDTGSPKTTIGYTVSTQNIFANGSSGTAGQVLYSNGTGVYWDLRPGNLSIGNLVYVMFYPSLTGSYYTMARGWVYKSGKTSNIATIYFKFYDYYRTTAINPSWGTVGTANNAWTIMGTEIAYNTFASEVTNRQLYGLDFYSGYNYAGSTSIMPAFPNSASGAITLKYPSGGLAAYTTSVTSGSNPTTDSTWGYAPNNYITFSYSLDGTLDSRISTFNYP